jgi:hypothetical protein
VADIVTVDIAELEPFVAVHNAVRQDDPATVEGFVDWKRQAEDMVWLLARENGKEVGAGVGLVGL